MAIHFVGRSYDSHRGSATGMSRQPPNGVTWSHPLNSGLVDGTRDHVRSGDLVIAVMSASNSSYAAPSYIVRDPSGADYNELCATFFTNAESGSMPKNKLKVGWKIMGSTTDDTIWMGQSNDPLAGICHVIYVFEGVDQTTPFDGVTPAIFKSLGLGINPPAITPLTPGAMIVAIGASHASLGNQRLTQAGDLGYFNSWYGNELWKTTVGFGHYHDWAYGSGPFNPGPWTLDGDTPVNRTNSAITFALRTEGAVPGGGTGGGAGVWNGTARVSKPVKYWNGTSFVTKPLKFWNGTSWVTTP